MLTEPSTVRRFTLLEPLAPWHRARHQLATWWTRTYSTRTRASSEGRGYALSGLATLRSLGHVDTYRSQVITAAVFIKTPRSIT